MPMTEIGRVEMGEGHLLIVEHLHIDASDGVPQRDKVCILASHLEKDIDNDDRVPAVYKTFSLTPDASISLADILVKASAIAQGKTAAA